MTLVTMQNELENKPIRDIAYENLKHAIITGELTPGSRIVETLYANKLHISRTPLREALRKLELDGLVHYELRRGVIVNAFTLSDIDEIFTIRNAMMMLLLPSVVEKAKPEDLDNLNAILKKMDAALEKDDCEALAILNRQFHDSFEHISDKKRILSVIDGQQEYIIRFSAVAIQSLEHRRVAHDEHHEMVRLLREKDLESLKSLMQRHLEDSKESCLRALRNREF